MAVWSHCCQVGQVDVHAVRRVCTQLVACACVWTEGQMYVCVCLSWSTDVVYRMVIRSLLACQSWEEEDSVGLNACSGWSNTRDGQTGNRKQTSGSSQSPLAYWSGNSNQSGNSLFSTNLWERTKRTMFYLNASHKSKGETPAGLSQVGVCMLLNKKKQETFFAGDTTAERCSSHGLHSQDRAAHAA